MLNLGKSLVMQKLQINTCVYVKGYKYLAKLLLKP